ncbi:hypothetical protein [Weissella paramesenteroides]|uniref:hypothetical protein n=1 Tax=Weissella paramesenteroides TaxID=1249 RepID=UPI003857D58C
MDDEIVAIRLASNQRSLPYILAFKLRSGRVVYAEQMIELLDSEYDFLYFPLNKDIHRPFYVETKPPIADFSKYVGSLLPNNYPIENSLFDDPLLTLKRF